MQHGVIFLKSFRLRYSLTFNLTASYLKSVEDILWYCTFCRKLVSIHHTYPLIKKKKLSSLYINAEDFKKDDTYLMPPNSQKNKLSSQYQN